MHKRVVAAVIAAASLTGSYSTTASALESGDWLFRIGMTNVDPKQGNGDTVAGRINIDDDTQLTFTGTYMFTPNWGLELLASLPFEHDFSVAGIGVGSTKYLPPTLSLQYHFNPGGDFVPYVGAGLNYTIFFSTKTYGALDVALGGGDLELEDSFGPALQAGVDFMLSERLLLNLDVRWIKIESDVKLNGTKVGEAEVDPLLVGVNIGWKF